MSVNLFLELIYFHHKFQADTLIAAAVATNVIFAGSMGSQSTHFTSQVTEFYLFSISFDQPIYSPNSISQNIEKVIYFVCSVFSSICQRGRSKHLKGPLLCCAGITNT
jgi:hypothetical protein